MASTAGRKKWVSICDHAGEAILDMHGKRATGTMHLKAIQFVGFLQVTKTASRAKTKDVVAAL